MKTSYHTLGPRRTFTFVPGDIVVPNNTWLEGNGVYAERDTSDQFNTVAFLSDHQCYLTQALVIHTHLNVLYVIDNKTRRMGWIFAERVRKLE